MVNLNGQILKSEAASIGIENRGFKYGDGLFETIRFGFNKPLFFEDHYFRLMAGMRILRMKIPMTWTPEFLEEEIKKTIASHESGQEYRIRLSVFRSPGGKYQPESSSPEFLIEAEPLENRGYLLNESGLKIDLFKDHYRAKSLLSNYKTLNAMVNILGGVFAKENGLDDVVILNDQKYVSEAISSNIFLVFENKLVTPAISEGCVKGIIRGRIIKHAKQWGYEVEERPVSPFELQKADEVFFTNAIKGIQWVSNYRLKSFSNGVSKNLISKLNLQANLE